MIEVKQLSKRYGAKTALHLPELTVPDGQCVGLVGNNGAGKTTFFNLLLDLVRATTGTISSFGQPVHLNEDWKRHTGAYLDERFLIDYLTPEEYFSFLAGLRGQTKAELEALLNGLGPFFAGEVLGTRKYLRDLSKGNMKKAGVASALIGAPKLVVLDEPFANLDPSSQLGLKSILKQMALRREVTMLISSHDLAHVTEVCERILVLEKGELVKDLRTTPETLKELEAMFTTAANA